MRPEIDQTKPITVHTNFNLDNQPTEGTTLQPDEYSFGTYGITYRFRENPNRTILINWYRIDYIYQDAEATNRWSPDGELTHEPVSLTQKEQDAKFGQAYEVISLKKTVE